MAMSRRKPDMHTQNNTADNIERYLEEDGHRKWGFVIYRCTYENNSDWEEFMARLRYRIRNTLEFYNGLDMMDSLLLTVFDDKSLFDDASTMSVREHFKQWTATAPAIEQGEGVAASVAQRYRFCIQVDEAALESVVRDAPDASTDGFVNLIWKDWAPRAPDPREPEEEEIEGCTQHDVGWMMVAYQDAVVDMYDCLRD